ncbi:MAG: hypothetical protein RL417_987 [Pseudomonadota bacterium]
METLKVKRIDVAIIGGGASGLGAARAVAECGYSAAVLERGECGRGTSDNSLRIVHGGFRYLQSFDLPRVLESLRAQARLRAEYPELIKPLPCVMPLDRRGVKSRYPLAAAQFLFQGLGAFAAGGAPRTGFLSREEVEREVTCLRGRAPHGALLWTDGLMIDPRSLLARWADRCRELGVSIQEGIEVRGIAERNTGLCVETSGGDFECGALINAAGPAIHRIDRRDGGRWPIVSGYARAFNVVVRSDLVGGYGVALPGDRRLLFAVRRGENTALGTGYLPMIGEGDTTIAESEVAAFLIEVSRGLPEPLTLNDVVGVDSGLLPIVGPPGGTLKLQGGERIERDRRVITVVSTKYTTFYEQGKKIAKVLRRILG